MFIFMTILKILGIILLIILGVILLILFAPVTYVLRLDMDERADANKIVFKALVKWLWFVLRIPVIYDDRGISVKVRIFGICIKKNMQGTKEDPNDEENERTETPDEDLKDKPVKTSKKSPDDLSKNKKKREEESTSTADKGEKRKNKKERKSIIYTIKKTYRMVRKRVHSVYDLKEILKKPVSKRAIAIIRENVVHLWWHIKPDRIRGDVVFGMDDPAITGEILGIVSIIYIHMGKKFVIRPDFENKCYRGYIDIKGNICLIFIIIIGLKILLNKDVRALKRRIDKWKEEA